MLGRRHFAALHKNRSLLGILSMEGFGAFFVEALRCFEQKLDLDCVEWKDDASTFGTIENARIQQGRDV